MQGCAWPREPIVLLDACALLQERMGGQSIEARLKVRHRGRGQGGQPSYVDVRAVASWLFVCPLFRHVCPGALGSSMTGCLVLQNWWWMQLAQLARQEVQSLRVVAQ